MAEGPQARDNFREYFAEKLWEMIPGIYRHEDGIAEQPGVLRALVEILAEQAAILRRSHDRLWEDQFIELCDDWAVPYLADLVGTRLVSALNQRGRRVDVAKTIYYRRRKGTLRVLEELISDIAGWEGTVVEGFRRLGRTRHGLDPQPAPLAGRLSGTLPGGWADLRRPRAAELAGGPFDEFHHTADVRRHHGEAGRYGIPKLAFHLCRLRAFRVEGVTPFRCAANKPRFTFDPSGRDVPLFMPRSRPQDPSETPRRAKDWDAWRPAREWELPAPLRCRVLGHAEYVIGEALVQQLVGQGLAQAAADVLRKLHSIRFSSEQLLSQALGTPAWLTDAVYESLLAGALVQDCGKKALLPRAVSVRSSKVAVPPERTVAGNLGKWMPNPPQKKRLVIDPERGRFLFLGPAPASITATYHYGFSDEIGAGTYDRRQVEAEERAPGSTLQGGGGIPSAALLDDGVTQIEDNATYGPVGDKLGVKALTLQAANQRRPYVRLVADWVLDSGPNQDAELLLDGIWLGSAGKHALILRGDYERVTIQSCTFDPGGTDANKNPIPPLPLVVEAQVEELVIASSIMGPIRTRAGGAVEKTIVQDSIVQSIHAGTAALALPAGEVAMERTTVFGSVDVDRLWASEALVTGPVNVTNTQDGCFRFSAAPGGSRLPRPYESHSIADSNYLFVSRRFGDPGYGQLSEEAPLELQRGAENGSEIGAFSSLLNPIKMDSLQAKVDEYMPFGLIPIWIMET